MKQCIFISHSSKDIKYVETLISIFENHKIDKNQYFIDFKDINAGDNIISRIRESLKNTDICLFILSKSFINSKWTQVELDISIKQLIEGNKRKLIGILFEEISIEDPFLNLFKILDFTSEKSIKTSTQILLKEFRTGRKEEQYEIILRQDEALFDYCEYIYFNNKFTFEKIVKDDFGPYSDLFNYLIVVQGQHIENVSSSNIFHKIQELICNSHDEIPLLIEGSPGTGKSTFLSVLYTYLKDQYLKQKLKFLPVYINIDEYNTYLIEDIALNNLRKDIDPIINYISEQNIEPIFIIDGIDDYLKSILDLNSHILNYIANIIAKKIIVGLSRTDRFSKTKNEINLNIKSKIIFKPISELDTNFDTFLNFFTRIYSNESFNIAQNTKLRKFIEALNPEYIDFFVLLLLSRNLPDSIDDIDSIAQLYTLVANIQLRNNDRYLRNISKQAYDFYVNGVKDNEYIKHNLPGWNLIHSHISFRDFFIARHIVNSIISYGKEKNDSWLSIFSNVYPSTINKFCKQIINHTYNLQNAILEGIKISYDKVDLTGKTHFCYILGRFKHDYPKSEARKFLNSKLSETKKGIQRIDGETDEQIARYIRTLYISLAYLGDKNASNHYVNLILFDKEYDLVNRGFHLEYYGDIDYVLTDHHSLTSKDKEYYSIANTFIILSHRIKSSLNSNLPHKLFNIELHTLCSLIQHRHLHGKIKYANEIKELISIIEDVLLKPKFCNHRDLTKYISFLKGMLENQNLSSELDLFKPIYRIKEIKRTGWNREDKGRKVTECETVASHMYGCILIAKFYLPESLGKEMKEDFPVYSKKKIIDILLFHDLGEYKTGDISSDQKTQLHIRDEEMAMVDISMLSSYESFGYLKNIENDWKIFENSMVDDDIKLLNYQIAKEIDKIENLLQLLVYYFDKEEKIPDFEDFFINLYEQIITDISMDVCQKIYTPYYRSLLKFPRIKLKLETAENLYIKD